MEQQTRLTSAEPISSAGAIGGASQFKNRWRLRPHTAWVLLTLVLVGLGWRSVRYGLGFPIWGDEGAAASSLLWRDFPGMLGALDYGQILPAGFMWAQLAITRVLGLSEYALRVLPYLCGLASLILFWRFAKRILGRRSAILAVGIFAVSYYVVRHSAELKPYASDLLVSLILTYLGWWVSQGSASLLRWLLLAAAAALGVWVSYPSVFVSGAVILYLICVLVRSPSPKAWAGWVGFCLVLGVSFLAMYLLHARLQAEATPKLVSKTWNSAFPPMSEPLQLLFWLLRAHTGNMLAYPIGGKYGGSTLTLILVLLGCLIMWRRRRVMLILLLSPLVLNFIAAAMKRYPYGTSARTSLYMAPAFCLLAGLGLSAALKACLRRQWVPVGFRVAAAVLAGIAIAGIARDIARPYKKRSDQVNRSSMRWLARQTESRDRWVVFNALTDVPHAPNLYRWKGSASRFSYYVVHLAAVLVRWGPKTDELSQAATGRTWLITYRDNDEPFPEEKFARYLQAMSERLGPPRRKLFDLGTPEAIDIYEFSPTCSAAPASPAAAE